MSSSSDTERIETPAFLLEETTGGRLEIHNLRDGTSIELGADELSMDQARAFEMLLRNNEDSSNSFGEDRIFVDYAQQPEYSSHKPDTWGLRIEHIGDGQILAFWNWDNGNLLEVPAGLYVDDELRIPVFTADPDSGNIWIRSDLDTLRYRVNGTVYEVSGSAV